MKVRLTFVLLAALTHAAQAQRSPLTLQQAAAIALEKNPLRKAALAETKAASADVQTARSLLLPHVNFTETATRGNDPVYVFGTRLRQQRFTQADFALNKLNAPLPIGNFATRHCAGPGKSAHQSGPLRKRPDHDHRSARRRRCRPPQPDRLLGSRVSLPHRLRQPGIGRRHVEFAIPRGDAMNLVKTFILLFAARVPSTPS